MTRQTLRNYSLKISKYTLIAGLPILVVGLGLSSPVITMFGCAILSITAYTMAFSVVGAAL